MKKNKLYLMYIALATSLTSQVSCLKAPDFGGIKSEVEVPNGAVNYFKNDMDFDFDGGSKIVAFSANLRWSMEKRTLKMA